MKRIMITAIAVACALTATALRASDPVQVDPKHYKVEFENDTVRVLRIQYGPGEKSVMHSHPAGVVIYLTDAESSFTFPDGKTQANSGKAGTVQEAPAGDHLPQNTGAKPMELILVEFKTKSAAK